MATTGDDCYFYCTSTCAKGALCPFRHVEAAKTNPIICQHWQTTGCLRVMCRYRHSDFHISINYSEVPCYWESQPVGCHKPTCPYKHIKPRPETKPDAVPVKPASPAQKDMTSPNNNEGEGDAFIMPTVKPVIIDPESEVSNSSPLKRPPPSSNDEETKKIDNKEEDDSVPTKKKKIVKDPLASKKAVKVVKKKKGVVTPKGGKSSVKKVTKMVKKGTLSAGTKKVAVKRKNVENEKKPVPAKIPVKDRLGGSHPASSSSKLPNEEDSSDDSDDSIENVKVLSMEEIFRQKALESMMKKRAAEGKPMLPTYSGPKKSAAPSQPTLKISSNVKPKPTAVKRKAPTPPPPQSESEEEEEEEEDTEEEEEEDASKEEDDVVETNDTEEDSESSSSKSDDSSSSEEESGVRRVVINLDAEKTARDRAKASFVKKRSLAEKVSKRKVVREKTRPLMSLTMSSPSRLSAKDRLGKVPTNRVVPVVSSRVNLKASSEGEVSEEDSDDKEEQHSEPLMTVSEKSSSSRQVLVSEDVEKKLKKRAWSAGTQKSSSSRVVQSSIEEVEDDERTVSATTPEPVSNMRTIDVSPDEQESLFEVLRRKALLKKTQHLKEQLFEPVNKKDDVDVEERQDGEEEEGGGGKKKKKHKHKHKHKHHKKSKVERQIYVPPGKKNSDPQVGSNQQESKRVVSPSHIMLSSSSSMVIKPDNEIAEYLEEAPSKSPPSQPSTTQTQRYKPKAASLWTAGLSVSAKGVIGRRPAQSTSAPAVVTESVPLSSRLGKGGLSSSFSSSSSSSSAEVPVVKTFSQIMAEKRQKRLQAQGKSCGDVEEISACNSSNPSSPSRPFSSYKTEESSKPRVPITPIRFDTDESKGKNLFTDRLKPAPIASTTKISPMKRSAINAPQKTLPTHNRLSALSSSPPPPISNKSTLNTISVSDLRPTYKKERAKKLFKKTSKPQFEVNDELDSQKVDATVHIPSPLQPSQSTAEDANKHRRTSSQEASVNDAGDPKTSPNVSAVKERRASTISIATTKSQISLLDDEFAFFEDGDIENLGDILDKDMEPIDDLLQDIDDLLA